MTLGRALRGVVLPALAIASAAPADAQHASVWLDANAAHSRPPAGALTEASNYALAGARVRLERRRSMLEIGASGGRGVADGSGTWLSSRALWSTARARGHVDGGVQVEAAGHAWLAPVRLEDGTEATQSIVAATVRPFGGVSVRSFRIGGEMVLVRGAWRAKQRAPAADADGSEGPGRPSSPPGQGGGRDAQTPVLQTTRTDGDVSLAGGALSLSRALGGGVTAELGVSAQQARNQVAAGRYVGWNGSVNWSAGAVDISAGARQQRSPDGETETGGHAGVGVPLRDGVYVQAVISRSVTDAVYGTAGGVHASAGMSVRVRRASFGPPVPAVSGAVIDGGRRVEFRLPAASAKTVAVAGDFSGWESRPLQRLENGEWVLETVLPPGVYHYAFVIDGAEWMVPANASGVVDDGFGRKNATLVVASGSST